MSVEASGGNSAQAQALGRSEGVLSLAVLLANAEIEGAVQRLSAAESDAYFQQRPLGARASAAASPQSEVVPDRAWLERRVEDVLRAHPHGRIPRPDTWGGLRVVPDLYEFWRGRKHRLHDRVRYRLEGGVWARERLAP